MSWKIVCLQDIDKANGNQEFLLSFVIICEVIFHRAVSKTR